MYELLNEGQCSWWLRTPGDNQNAVTTVSTVDVFNAVGYTINTSIGIRPAMWINLNE